MAGAATTPRIVQLATIISDSVGRLNNDLSSMGISTPSFDEGAPLSLPDDVSNDRDVILDAAAELFDILLDPLALIMYHGAVSSSVFLPSTRLVYFLCY